MRILGALARLMRWAPVLLILSASQGLSQEREAPASLAALLAATERPAEEPGDDFAGLWRIAHGGVKASGQYWCVVQRHQIQIQFIWWPKEPLKGLLFPATDDGAMLSRYADIWLHVSGKRFSRLLKNAIAWR